MTAPQCVNRAERIRWRAWQQARKGNLAAYWKLVGLSLEVGLIRYFSAPVA